MSVDFRSPPAGYFSSPDANPPEIQIAGAEATAVPSNAERQRAYREQHRGEPQGNPAMQAELAALQARVAHLEVELTAMPSASPRAPSGRLREAYQPGIAAKARAWVEQVDAAPRRRRRDEPVRLP